MDEEKNKIPEGQKNLNSDDMLNSKKFAYIVTHYMDGNVEEIKDKFGFKSASSLRRIRNGTTSMTDLHMLGLEVHFDIPQKVFESHIKIEDIDRLIEEYRDEKKSKEQSIYEDIFRYKSDNLMEALTNNKWYAHMYPSDFYGKWVKNKEGISITETTIYSNGTVIDEHGNRGTLKLGLHQSFIFKESVDERNINVIRFDNYQALYNKNFRFTYVIVSNQNGKKTEDMVNFGFYSSKRYPPQEAKDILGDIQKVQLKLDLDFNERVIKR